MTRKEITLIALVALLAGLYLFFFTGWFHLQPIRIEHTVRPGSRPMVRRGEPNSTGQNAANIIFALDHEYALTSLKVVRGDVYATNKNALPLWHLVADSNPAPAKGFVYGGDVTGLRPFVAGAIPEPLEADVPYRLLIEAGRLKGEHEFTIPTVPTARH